MQDFNAVDHPVNGAKNREKNGVLNGARSGATCAAIALAQHEFWMQQALAIARQAGEAGEVPVGAIVVNAAGEAIATGENRRERDHDPTAHAEVIALRSAGLQQKNWNLNTCTLYVTLEPCVMCAGAIVLARVGLLVYGADDFKAGAVRSVLNLPDSLVSNHRLPTIGGILEAPCREVLQTWFRSRRSPTGSSTTSQP